MLMPKTIWKPVKDYEGFYEVSNTGRVRSVKRKINVSNKRVGDFLTSYGGIDLKTQDSHGYRRVELNKDGKPKKFMVHRLVAMAFIDNPNNLPQVNHKDEDKTNNCVSNLEWCDVKYNSCYGTRLEKLSKKNGKEVIQMKDGKEIKRFHAIAEAERITGISHSIIWRVCNGKGMSAGGYQWKYATSEE